MTDNPASEIAIRERHERDAKNFRLGAEMTWQGQKQIHTDRATLLAEVERQRAENAELKAEVRAAADDALLAIDAMLADLDFRANSPIRMKVKRALEQSK